MLNTQALANRIDASVLSTIAPRVSGKRADSQTALIKAFGQFLPDLLIHIDVTTPLRINHFLAQTAHESDGFCTTVEYASGAAYEGRKDLGNIHTGDGRRFKGRGPIQLTGRANYRAFTAWLRKIRPECADFEASPELVAMFPWAGWAAAFFWDTKRLNAVADRDDLIAVTKIVNGGRNGLDDRALYLSRAKSTIAKLIADAMPSTAERPVLRSGSKGVAVDRLQRGLAAAGHYLLTIDGDFGPGTEGAVRTIQRARGLLVDGVVGSNTWAVIEPFLPETKV